MTLKLLGLRFMSISLITLFLSPSLSLCTLEEIVFCKKALRVGMEVKKKAQKQGRDYSTKEG